MAVHVSSLSVAVQGIAEFLDSAFEEDVVVIVDSPQRAAEKVKGGDKHLLNLFPYRVMPSNFHAAGAANQPLYVRLNVLVTPFTVDDPNVLDADMRLLGHAIRVLSSRPTIPKLLPGTSNATGDFRKAAHVDYKLEAVLQAPSMEELNHIWTTQGGELPYRLSAAYEFALIPIEALDPWMDAAPVRTSILDVRPKVPPPEASPMPLGAETRSFALASSVNGPGNTPAPPPTRTLPVVLFADQGSLSNAASVKPNTAQVPIALSGLPGSKAAISVKWTRKDATAAASTVQPDQSFTVAATRIDEAAAVVALALDAPKLGDKAVITTRAADATGNAFANSPFSNTLTLTVGAA